ncbi:MAG: Rho termination factor N-terminal domain-containing protein [Shimia sp.]
MARNLDDKTYDELFDMAAERGIEDRFKMNKEQLKTVLRSHDGTPTRANLKQKSAEELYGLAEAREIEGRSRMTKDELIEALAA